MKLLFIFLIIIVIYLMLASFFEFWPLNSKINVITDKEIQMARIGMETHNDSDNSPINIILPTQSTIQLEPTVILELEESIKDDRDQYKNCLKIEYQEQIGEEEYNKKCHNIEPNYFGKPLNMVNYFMYSDKYIPDWDPNIIQIELLPDECPDEFITVDSRNITLDNNLYKLWKEKINKLMSILTITPKPSSCNDIKQEDINDYYRFISDSKYHTPELDSFEDNDDIKLKLKEYEEEYIFGGNKETYEKVYNILSLCIPLPNESCINKDDSIDDETNSGLSDDGKSKKWKLDFSKSSCTDSEKIVLKQSDYPPRMTLPPELNVTLSPYFNIS